MRHGQTDWNKEKRLQGQKDIPLNQHGISQAHDTANRLKSIHFDAVFSSDLVRAKKTAEIITLERNLAIRTNELLREQAFGTSEGKVVKEFLALFTKWETLSEEERYHHVVDDEESPAQAVTRLITFLREVSVSHQGKTVLVVTHGGLMRYLLIRLGKATFAKPVFIGNTGYIKLRSDGVDFFVDAIEGVE